MKITAAEKQLIMARRKAEGSTYSVVEDIAETLQEMSEKLYDLGESEGGNVENILSELAYTLEEASEEAFRTARRVQDSVIRTKRAKKLAKKPKR